MHAADANQILNALESFPWTSTKGYALVIAGIWGRQTLTQIKKISQILMFVG